MPLLELVKVKEADMSSKPKYFRVKFGFDEKEEILVDEMELAKAFYIHLTGKKAIFKNGSVSGDKIISITPDWDSAPYVYNPGGNNFIAREVKEGYLLAMGNAQEEVTARLENRPPVLAGPSGPRIFTKGPTEIGKLLPDVDKSVENEGNIS